MKNFDFISGEIVYDEFNIDFSKPLEEQLDCLSEDLIQVKYEKGYLLDLGWYPEYETKGNFIIYIIKNRNWDKPIYKRTCEKKEELNAEMIKAIDMLQSCMECHEQRL